MLIRVVRAVNVFILPAGFSEKRIMRASEAEGLVTEPGDTGGGQRKPAL
jgi:hypothetical protein